MISTYWLLYLFLFSLLIFLFWTYMFLVFLSLFPIFSCFIVSILLHINGIEKSTIIKSDYDHNCSYFHNPLILLIFLWFKFFIKYVIFWHPLWICTACVLFFHISQVLLKNRNVGVLCKNIGLVLQTWNKSHLYGPIIHIFSDEVIPHIQIFGPLTFQIVGKKNGTHIVTKNRDWQ